MTTAMIVDAEAGRLVLTRTHLNALIDQIAGRDVVAELRSDLRASGAWRRGRAHPMLLPLLDTLARQRGRVVLRRWLQGNLPAVEVFVGDAGVFVLPGGPAMDAPQEVRWFERPTSVARVVADLIDLPMTVGTAPFDETPRPWSALVAAATVPYGNVGLCDLRWGPGRDPAQSVLVLAWDRQGGIVSIQPVGEPGPGRGGGSEGSGATGDNLVVCMPSDPLQVWTHLTVLAKRAWRSTAVNAGSSAPVPSATVASEAEADAVEGIA